MTPKRENPVILKDGSLLIFLKPCPFCGSTVELVTPDPEHDARSTFVACTNPRCNIATRIQRKDHMIISWNKRAKE